MKFYKRSFFPLLLLIYSTICFASTEKVKLSCKLEILVIYSDGYREKLNKTALFEVSFSENYLYIASLTDDFASVTTNKRTITKYISNRSDDNRWDLSNHDILHNDDSFTRIMIDRNTGQILYTRNWKNSTIETQGHGFCSKVDTSKKKF